MPTPHTEHIQNWRTPDSEIDQATLRVNNIALTGRNSKNGYEYSQEALQQAVTLYDNKPVFLDHAANITRPHDRAPTTAAPATSSAPSSIPATNPTASAATSNSSTPKPVAPSSHSPPRRIPLSA
jgi:hypothetical protein